MSCEFQGTSDIYGLGVRVGLYTQILTSLLAGNFHEPAFASSRNTNRTYQVALLAGLILTTRGAGEHIYGLEGFITLLFCFAIAWVTSIQAYSAARAGASSSAAESSGQKARGVGDLLLGTAICCFGIWFIFVGLDDLPRTRCPETVFFFAPVALFGWFRTFLRIAAVALLCVSAGMLAWRTGSLGWKFWAMLRPGHMLPSPAHTAGVQQIHVSARKFLGGIAAMATFIVAVELTIVWNSIENVYACDTFSQLFPLVVGAAGLVQVVYDTCKAVILGDSRVNWGW